MEPASVALKKLSEQVLRENGSLPLVLLLEHLAPVGAMRAVAQKHGLSPKGGFRLERAPARVLAPLLAELRDPEQLDEVLALLLPAPRATAAAERPAGDAEARAAAEARQLLALRDGELQRLRDELERAREVGNRARERADRLDQQLGATIEQLTRTQRALEERAPAAGATVAGPSRDELAAARRLHEIEGELEGLRDADVALRRQLAQERSRVRELQEEVAELDALIPKSRRKKQKPLPPAPAPESRRFVLPRFSAAFYKSLEGKDRRAVERAFQAILLFCTEGHAYPGLEVKQLRGQDTWSLRASLGLRVYFRQLPDGDVELLELGDREDQNTTLRRLKDRS